MIRMLATTALGLVLANAALAQSPGTSSKTEQTPPSQSNTTSQQTSPAPSTTSPQQSTAPSQSSPAASTQNTQAPPPSSGSANNSSGTSNTSNSADSSRSQSGTTNSNTAGNPPASQQGANPPATNTNQAQDRTNPSSSNPSSNTNQAQQAPSAGTNQAQSPNASGTSQAQGERSGTNTASRTDVNLDRQQESRISASISRLNVRPLTNVNFSLNVGTVVPRDVQLSTLPPDVVEIVPQYRGYSFALVKDQIVVVDPATYKIVTVLPYSGQSTATTTTRERSASKFSDRDREVIRKHVKTRTEGRSEARTTGSTARTEIHVGDRVPETVEVEEFPSTVYQDAPDLREYRYIHRDTRTYVIEPRERRVIEEID
ncbi:DUF1236 domain-containing protein [Bradyrhizobium sp. USDA 4486]